ncbi:uncharacterized protein LOC125940863 [Dermacentor silvarum]|uniref:uncharacterized protein LOC125940863 n=1 Tax=Dermacentor silvarum TaxID=543639 RepID=UPI0021016CC3|nr:uncharacterized protein LOC125940863 [Dermacentor silvarum]
MHTWPPRSECTLGHWNLGGNDAPITDSSLEMSMASGGICQANTAHRAHALEAQSALNNTGSGLLVMFSSTLAVVDYVGESGAPGPTAPGHECESNLALDIDIICNTSAMQNYRTDIYDAVEVARYNVDVFAHFASFESKKTLERKMDIYLNYTSGGWAVFDIQRDVSAWCLSPDPYHRLQAMAVKLQGGQAKRGMIRRHFYHQTRRVSASVCLSEERLNLSGRPTELNCQAFKCDCSMANTILLHETAYLCKPIVWQPTNFCVVSKFRLPIFHCYALLMFAFCFNSFCTPTSCCSASK